MLEDVIAEVLKDYGQIDKDNIVDVIQQFALRGVTIDRTPRNPTLIFFDKRTGKKEEIYEHHCSQLAQSIPNIRQFHSEVNMYLKQVTIILAEVAAKVESTNDEFHDIVLSELLQRHVLPRATNSDNPIYNFEHLVKSDRRVKVFFNEFSITHVYDRNAKVILSGASEKTLEELTKVLNDVGFDNVELKYRPVKSSVYQQTAYQLSLLRSEIFSLSNIAKLILTVVSFILGFVAEKFL